MMTTTVQVQLPTGHVYKGVRYPAGVWITVPRAEYDHMRTLGWPVTMREAPQADARPTDAPNDERKRDRRSERTSVPYVTKPGPTAE